MTSTCGWWRRTACGLPSVDPLSTRMTGPSCRGMLASSSSRRFCEATTTVTWWTGTASRRPTVVEPLHRLGEALVQTHLGSPAENLPRQRGVGAALSRITDGQVDVHDRRPA